MKLSDVLSGDFFNHYIKTGKVEYYESTVP